jgi:AcrR family transcriptional regulator
VPTPRRLDADTTWSDRREEIVAAARAAIEEHGREALTGDIVERAGIARPNFYRYFASKEDLDLAVARNVYGELRGEVRKRLGRLDPSASAQEVIRVPIAVQVLWADRHPNLFRFVVSLDYQRVSPQLTAERRAFASEAAASAAPYFPNFLKNRDAAEAITVAVGGLIDAAILSWLHRRTESRKRLTDRLTTQAWLIIDQHHREISGDNTRKVQPPSKTRTRRAH